MKRSVIIVAVVGILLVIFSVVAFYQETSQPKGTGTLSGTATIGPVSPVCRANITSTTAPSPWSSNQVVVIPESGSSVYIPVNWIISQGCEVSGSFQVSLSPGTYKIDLTNCMSSSTRSFGCATLPKTVVVSSNSTTSINISVDTGIR